MGGYSFDAAENIPSLAGKVILVTGANAGIGKQTALELAKHTPSQVWIGARNVHSGNQAVSEIQAVASPETSVKLLEMDLKSFASVKRAAKQVMVESNRLDILILNAGMMGGHPGVTEDGYENAFGTNHMGHALLLKLLTPLLLNASSKRVGADARVVILSSAGHKSGVLPKDGIEFSTLKSDQLHLSGVSKYCQSKLANAIYAAAVAHRYPEFTTTSINPGEVKTALFSKGIEGGGWVIRFLNWFVVPFVGGTVEEGAKNSLWAATAQEVENGAFYDPVGKRGGESDAVKDGKLGERLWEWTEKELRGHDM
ncbi:NAD(P)-binding protein [Lentithecium fluviatile CBS 122367]|uniref:NAD(P)-binding protein n=1 Tax=Lentithecium fluviatile CBS 122367 TaxID=1168545 RepID=A0A6G1ISH1_9PLEO|nr:NAD(P)-binding protein [Lentithecium fluviatile CBS 122367]